jgi:NAD-dependent dihydropyrimidine dehydrogenase PreA subunit
MAHRKMGYRFENDWTDEYIEEYQKEWKAAITIPVNVEVKADHLVLNLNKAKEYLIKSDKIAVLDCNCRKKQQNCDAPVNVCLPINDVAEIALYTDKYKERNPREVSYDEAVEILKLSHEAGLIHMAYSIGEDRSPEDINVICSCCTCCCVILSGMLRYGIASHLLTGLMTSVTEDADCIDCGVCVERCQFGAREMKNGVLSYYSDKCFGCGLCVSTCPTNAITLIDKQ